MSAENRGILVWIVEDEKIYRAALAQGLSLVLNSSTREFGSCEEVLVALESHKDRPDILLLDIGLPGISGLRALPRLRSFLPGVPILMLTHETNGVRIESAVRAGADGYVLKSKGLDEVTRAINNLLLGERHFDSKATTELLRRLIPDGRGLYKLTDRE